MSTPSSGWRIAEEMWAQRSASVTPSQGEDNLGHRERRERRLLERVLGTTGRSSNKRIHVRTPSMLDEVVCGIDSLSRMNPASDFSIFPLNVKLYTRCTHSTAVRMTVIMEETDLFLPQIKLEGDGVMQYIKFSDISRVERWQDPMPLTWLDHVYSSILNLFTKTRPPLLPSNGMVILCHNQRHYLSLSDVSVETVTPILHFFQLFAQVLRSRLNRIVTEVKFDQLESFMMGIPPRSYGFEVSSLYNAVHETSAQVTEELNFQLPGEQAWPSIINAH